MITAMNPRLRGRRLEPVEWRVRASMSPFWLGWGWRGRWWALLICDEGLAAFEWPSRKYWSIMLRVGLRAGLTHSPTIVDGDEWPLSERDGIVVSRKALLFPREELTLVDINRSRWFWSRVRLCDLHGDRWSFTAADPRRMEQNAALLVRHFGATKSGYWRRAG